MNSRQKELLRLLLLHEEERLFEMAFQLLTSLNGQVEQY
jgi:hypothetical protein